jgi:hypothetical protein
MGATNSVPENHAMDPTVEYDPRNVRVSRHKMWDLEWVINIRAISAGKRKMRWLNG